MATVTQYQRRKKRYDDEEKYKEAGYDDICGRRKNSEADPYGKKYPREKEDILC
jgi:hypothetical protein